MAKGSRGSVAPGAAVSLMNPRARFRVGLKELIEGGHDPEDVDAAVVAAEDELRNEAQAKEKQRRTRQPVKRFWSKAHLGLKQLWEMEKNLLP